MRNGVQAFVFISFVYITYAVCNLLLHLSSYQLIFYQIEWYNMETKETFDLMSWYYDEKIMLFLFWHVYGFSGCMILSYVRRQMFMKKYC